MVNGNSEEEVKDAAATDAEPEAEVVDAEIVEEADSPEPSGDEASEEASAEAAVAKAKEEAAEWQGKYLRLHAEWDTYRRRMKEQREEESRRATEKLVEDIIPVLDDVERSINYANENGEEGLLGGVTAVYASSTKCSLKKGSRSSIQWGNPTKHSKRKRWQRSITPMFPMKPWNRFTRRAIAWVTRSSGQPW